MRRRPLVVAVLAAACLLVGASSANATITITGTSPANPVNEGQTGTTPVIYTVTRQAAPLAGPASVRVQTADETATGGEDYVPLDQTVTFPGALLGGTQTTSVEVDVSGDTISEDNETFRVGLSDASGDTIGTPSFARTTIADAGPLPSLSVSNASVQEGTGGTGPTMHIPVILTPHSERTVSVHYAVVAGTATTGDDFTPVSGTLTFTAGQTNRTIDVPVVPDNIDENDETVNATIDTPTAATIDTAAATGTIVDDDTSTIAITDVRQAEGNAGLTAFDFSVRLSTPSDHQVTVDWATKDIAAGGAFQPAVAGTDYDAANGTVTFPAGVVSRTVTVQVHGNTTIEPTKRFEVDLTNPTGAATDPAHTAAFGDILDDDTPTPAGGGGGGGGTPPPPTTTPKTTPPKTTPKTKADKTLPSLKITRPKGHALLVVRGTAKDTGSGVAYVQVGVVYLDAQGCHYLAAGKRFKKSACTTQVLAVKATGKKSWRLRLPASVRGPIVIYARAVDRAGNIGKIKQLRLVVS